MKLFPNNFDSFLKIQFNDEIFKPIRLNLNAKVKIKIKEVKKEIGSLSFYRNGTPLVLKK